MQMKMGGVLSPLYQNKSGRRELPMAETTARGSFSVSLGSPPKVMFHLQD